MKIITTLLFVSAFLITAPAAVAGLSGTGHLDAAFVTAPMDRAIVEGLLPEGLELADATSPSVPVILIFGHHHDVHPQLSSLGGLDYLEFIFGVPNVQLKGGAPGRLLTFMPRLFLDREVPIWMGLPYGFAKKLAEVHSSDGHYAVRNPKTHELVIAADWSAQGDFENPFEILGFDQVQAILSEPLVGKTPLGLVCSDFDWGLRSGSVQPLHAQVDLVRPFLPGLEAGHYEAASIDEQPFGAFRVVTQWTLSLPHSCR